MIAAALLLAIAPWSPQVTMVLPAGAQRGTEIVITVTGQRLGEPLGLLQVRAGLTAIAFESDKPDRCKITLKVADDCPLGAHPLRLRTSQGLSNLFLFQVGTLPEVLQDIRQPQQTIPLGCTVNGNLRADVVDRYQVDLPAQTLVHCEVQAMRLGFGPIDLALQVTGPDGHLVAAADDTAFGLKDPLVTFRTALAGVYVVQVNPAFADQANTGSYRLHVGTFPRPLGALPCGGQPGEELEVQLVGDPGWDGQPIRVRLPMPGEDGSDDVFRWFPADVRGTAPTPVLLRIGGPPTVKGEEKAAEGKEPAKTIVTLPGSVHGVLKGPEPAQLFHFQIKANEELEFRVMARTLRSPLDAVVTVRQQGRVFVTNDDATGLDSVARFKAPADGEYVVEIRDLRNLTSPDRMFRLEAARPAEPPSLRMVTGQRDEAALAIPQGGRCGAVLQWSGADPDAGLELLAQQLPPGVSASFGAMPRGTNQLPMVLTAEASAPQAGAQLGFLAKAQKEPLERDPGFAQVVPLVYVRNNQPILGMVMRQMPVAVTAPAPFTLELLAPAVPVVCGAGLGLRVRITRSDGFTEGVRVRALWNPPGVSAGQLNLQGGNNEGVLQVDANANATAGTFPYAVIAQTRIQNGGLAVSSALVPLQVDKPWITAEVGKVRTEQGNAAQLQVKLKPASGRTANCHVVLVGLPKGVSAQEVDAAEGSESVAVPLTVAADAAAGRHRGFQVELRVPSADQQVVHRFGGGEIRIDKPLPGAPGNGGGEERR